MKRIRILLAHGHQAVLERMRKILDSLEFELVGAVRNGRALVQAAAELQPDVIIGSVAMPALSGIEVARRIRRQRVRAKLIFLAAHGEPSDAIEALNAGGSGYVLESSSSTEIAAAVREVINGAVYVSEAVAGFAKSARKTRPAKGKTLVGELTPRQLEVLRLLAEGRQVKEIAVALDLSPRTVEFHKYQIMGRLGVRTIAGLTRYAVRRGIVS
jgi:DNA-binding NarL/FixJ family response regulator